MELLEKVTAEVNYFQLKKDAEIDRKNYQEAHDYYHQVYNQRMFCYAKRVVKISKNFKDFTLHLR